MGELIRREAAAAPSAFEGERLTSAISGQVSIEHYHRYLLARDLCRGRDVLDVAAGEGYGTALIAQVASSAIGVEIDAEVVAAARVEFARPNLRYEQGDARSLPLGDASVDVVVSFETLEHLLEQQAFLSELRRVLRPGGLLLISTPDRDIYSPLGTDPNPFHVLELSRPEFRALLGQHFAHVAFAAQRPLIGSAILHADGVPLRTYENRSDTIIEASDGLARAPYLLALASDAALPPLPNSVFVHRSDLDTDAALQRGAELRRLAAEQAAAEAAERARVAEAGLAHAEQLLREADERAVQGGEREANARDRFAALEHACGLMEEARRRGEVDAASSIAERDARVAALTAELGRTSERAEQAGSRLERADAQSRAQAQRLEEREERLAESLGRSADLEFRLAEAAERAAQSGELLVRTREQVEQDRAARIAVERRLDAERDAHARLREHAAQVESHLHAIETSSSWKATHLLRSAGQRAPSVSRGVRRGANLAWWTVTLQLPRRYRLWRQYAYLRRPGQPSVATLESTAPTGALPPAEPGEERLATGAATEAAPSPAEMPPPAEPVPPLVDASAAPMPEFRIDLASSNSPAVSVIIPTYGQVDATLACLRSIAAHAPRVPIEVIVVDDSYPGPEDVGLLRRVGGVQLVRTASNLGFLRSCNHAARFARGAFLHFLNNDTELLPGSIDALADLLDARPDAGLAGSRLMSPDGRLQEAGGILWNDASGWNYGRGDDPARPEYGYLREADYCSGASIMVRREVFEALDGFDEAFAPAYYEDADLAFRIREAGLKVFYEPLSVVVHHEGLSHGTDLSSGVKAHQVTNQALMLERWGAVLRAEHYPGGQHVLRARDRARHRRTILVIDHYAPEPDRDAGSRSLMGIIRSVLSAGWVVKFWPLNRAYSTVYTTALERSGIEVLDGRWPGDLGAWLRENGGELDHLLVVRPDVALDVLPDLMRTTDAVLSFYGVDLHFARMQRQHELDPAPGLARQITEMKRLEQRVWRHFDVVLYPSEEEAAVVRALSPRTLVRGIVPFCFDDFPPPAAPPRGHSILFVAGFAHPPNVDAAMFLVREVIPRLEQEIGAVEVTLAGSNPTAQVKALAGPGVTVTGYVTDEALGTLYGRHRASVVPLRFGAGVKGKVVESLSHGVPLVTTSIGTQGIAGLDEVVPVHDDAEGIAEALLRLLTDDAAWMAQSAAQIAFARRFFSPQAMQRSVLAALEAGEAADVRQATRTADCPSPAGSVLSMDHASDLVE